MGINLRFFKIRFIFHAGLFRPIVGYRRRALYQVLWTSADTAQLRRGILRKATEVSNIQRLSDVRKAAKLDWDKIFFSNQQVVRKKSVTDNKYGA